MRKLVLALALIVVAFPANARHIVACENTQESSPDTSSIIIGTDQNDCQYGYNLKDWLEGKKGHDHQFGGSGPDELEGNDGHDYMQGDDGNDTLFGRAGDDYLFGGSGKDRCVGGGGDDYISPSCELTI